MRRNRSLVVLAALLAALCPVALNAMTYKTWVEARVAVARGGYAVADRACFRVTWSSPTHLRSFYEVTFTWNCQSAIDLTYCVEKPYGVDCGLLSVEPRETVTLIGNTMGEINSLQYFTRPKE
jgi:hypothetical protein